MQIEINAVIITDSVDNMKKIKELLRAKAKTALNNAKDEDEGTRLDIDGFFIESKTRYLIQFNDCLLRGVA